MPDLTKREKDLFAAIRVGNEPLTCMIIKTEESGISNGSPSQISPTAQDEEGNMICHAAAQSGSINIISRILLSIIKFIYTVPNTEGLLPVDKDWSGNFKKFLPLRQDRDKEDEAFQSYTKKYNEIVQQELQNHGYKKGIIFTSNFLLECTSKNNKKNCLISDKNKDDEYSIHDRQAIDEAVLTNQRPIKEKGKWLKSPRPLASQNFLLANIGFVIGEEWYTKTKLIERKFHSIPIIFPLELYSPENKNKNELDELFILQNARTSSHSESNLYGLLLTPFFLKAILDQFRESYGLLDGEQRKIYACIIDTHSSQDMCDECELETYSFQEKLVTLINILAKDNCFLVSKSCRTVVRASSSRASSHSDYRIPFHKREIEPEKYKDFFARDISHNHLMDIRKSENFILHYDSKTRDERGAGWYEKNKLIGTTIKNIVPRTCFFVTKSDIPYSNPVFPKNYEIKDKSDLLKLKLT
ncbi:MAG: hypothetical protein ACK4PR_01230 [Gammaproteobacteria bacterium]